MILEDTEMLVPDRILQLLEVEGIDTLFGIPDPCFAPLFALAEQRGWKVITPQQEQAGGFLAADLYHHTGIPGAVIGNDGASVSLLAPAAVAATRDNIPTIFIAGRRERNLEAAVKFFGIIDHPDRLDDTLHEAFRRAFTGIPGPVYIAYPREFSASRHSFGPLKQPEEYRLV